MDRKRLESHTLGIFLAPDRYLYINVSFFRQIKESVPFLCRNLYDAVLALHSDELGTFVAEAGLNAVSPFYHEVQRSDVIRNCNLGIIRENHGS